MKEQKPIQWERIETQVLGDSTRKLIILRARFMDGILIFLEEEKDGENKILGGPIFFGDSSHIRSPWGLEHMDIDD